MDSSQDPAHLCYHDFRAISFPKTLSPQLTRRSVATSRTNSEQFARGTSQICQSIFKILKETNRKMENESQFDEELLGKHEIHVYRLKVKAEELMQDFDLIIEIAANSVHSTN